MSITSKIVAKAEKLVWEGGRILEEGKKAPDFSLSDQAGITHRLSEYLGKKVVAYFYPKDDTPGCTKEACSFRDNFSEYKKRGIAVLGISGDDVKSHDKFANKYSLPFTLLSDPGFETCKAYGVYGEKSFMGKKYNGIRRTTFIIDEKGFVALVLPEVDCETHAQDVLALIS